MTFLLLFFISLTILFIFFVCYFLPVIVAYVRNHKNIAEIIIMNTFLGWTIFGWLAALLWSLNSDIKESET